MSESARSLYMERKVAGLCTKGCGLPAAEDSTLCQSHREERNRLAAACMKRKRDALRAEGKCIVGCGRDADGDYACPMCRVQIDRYKHKWLSVGDVNTDVNTGKADRIAARTSKDPDGRTRYRGQQRRGQQTHAQLNMQDLNWAREIREAHASGETIAALAARYEAQPSTISRIVRGLIQTAAGGPIVAAGQAGRPPRDPGWTTLSVELPPGLRKRIDGARGETSASAWLREAAEQRLAMGGTR